MIDGGGGCRDQNSRYQGACQSKCSCVRGVVKGRVFRGRFTKWAKNPGSLVVGDRTVVWPCSLVDQVLFLENYLREQIRGFRDLLRQKPASLLIWLGWNSISQATLTVQSMYRNFVVRMEVRPPLWSSGQSSWLQSQRYQVRFPVLPGFLSGSGSGMGSTQPLEHKWWAASKKK
jgi:hypothetical protein